MSVYLNYLTRSSTGSIRHSGAPLSGHCLIQRRFYAGSKSSDSHYDALGIKTGASAKEIKTAFYKLSKKHHPDVNPDDASAAQKFSTISNAYDVLGDPVKRREYDNELHSRTSSSDPYVTYDRTSTYAQRARAHRPSSWKPPPSSRTSGGFQGAENAFGSSQNASYGTFDKEYYDSVFGRYRGPPPKGRSNIYDFDEFYRAHYNDFQNWTTVRKQAQEKMRREKEAEETRREQKANRTMASKLSLAALWLSAGLLILFVSSALHEMQFQKPSEELRTQFYIIPKATTAKKKLPPDESSTKP
jgi:curved DNA-binding protein CbpA